MDYLMQVYDWLIEYGSANPRVFFVLVVSAILSASIIMFRITMHFDGRRVARYFMRMNGVLEDFRWRPFGPGWFGERNARIYKIQYRDAEDRVHTAYVKTSFWTGVYLTGDKVVYDGRVVAVF